MPITATSRVVIKQHAVDGGIIIEPGIHADNLLDYAPSAFISRVIGSDGDGLVVEWQWGDIVLTLARAKGLNPVTGGEVDGYYLQKLEKIVNE